MEPHDLKFRFYKSYIKQTPADLRSDAEEVVRFASRLAPDWTSTVGLNRSNDTATVTLWRIPKDVRDDITRFATSIGGEAVEKRNPGSKRKATKKKAKKKTARRRNAAPHYGRQYEMSEWLDFLTRTDEDPEDQEYSAHVKALYGKFMDAVRAAIVRHDESPQVAFDWREHYDDGQEELAYNTFASAVGHGVGLWEEDEAFDKWMLAQPGIQDTAQELNDEATAESYDFARTENQKANPKANAMTKLQRSLHAIISAPSFSRDRFSDELGDAVAFADESLWEAQEYGTDSRGATASTVRDEIRQLGRILSKDSASWDDDDIIFLGDMGVEFAKRALQDTLLAPFK